MTRRPGWAVAIAVPRASRCAAHGGASGRTRRHEFAAFHPRLYPRLRSAAAIAFPVAAALWLLARPERYAWRRPCESA